MPKGSKEKFRRISADEHADDEEEDEEKKTGKRRLAAQMAAKLRSTTPGGVSKAGPSSRVAFGTACVGNVAAPTASRTNSSRTACQCAVEFVVPAVVAAAMATRTTHGGSMAKVRQQGRRVEHLLLLLDSYRHRDRYRSGTVHFGMGYAGGVRSSSVL